MTKTCRKLDSTGNRVLYTLQIPLYSSFLGPYSSRFFYQEHPPSTAYCFCDPISNGIALTPPTPSDEHLLFACCSLSSDWQLPIHATKHGLLKASANQHQTLVKSCQVSAKQLIWHKASDKQVPRVYQSSAKKLENLLVTCFAPYRYLLDRCLFCSMI